MLQNKIYQNYIIEILKNFFIVLFSFSIIAWTVKAVNYLNLIVESGYSTSTYLIYSLLSLTGVLTKFIPLSFLVTIVFFIIKHNEEKELTILWTSGVKKIHLVNLIFISSILILSFYLIFSVFVTPYSLNQSRKLLSNKNDISIMPIIKNNKFSDAYKGLTLIVDKKIKNELRNIFIFDSSDNFKNLGNTDTGNEILNIIAKKGIVEKGQMVLLNGQIITSNTSNLKNKVIKFEQMNLDLQDLENNVVKKPKIQETSTFLLMKCFGNKATENIFCSKGAKDIIPNLNRRFIMPFYIPIISLLSCFLLIKSKSFIFSSKTIIFLISFFVLLFAELSIRYTGISKEINYLFILFPFVFLIFIYLFLKNKFSKETIIENE